MKIIRIPIITKNESNISCILILFFLKIGSIIDVKNAVVDKHVTASDTL